MHFTFVTLSLVCAALARPTVTLDKRQGGFALKNGQDAIALNNKFAGLNANSPCQAGENACVNNGFAQCVGGKFVVQGCAPGTICAALPLVNAPGTSITCTTAADRDARIAATGAKGPSAGGNTGNNNGGSSGGNTGGTKPTPNTGNNGGNNGGNGGNNGGGDAQTSRTLDPAVIATGFANNGQSKPEPGQVASLTSSNNFINFCKTVNRPITNGAQIADGSCNPAPMGVIAAKSKMPASKFLNPANLGKVKANTPFTVQMAIQNLETGHFVNAQENYFSAPQQVNGQGVIQGHSHIVMQKMESLTSNKILDPTVFAFFKGLNGAAQNGVLSTEVTNGLPRGVYRLASINAAANHQPVLVAVAQHGSLDDVVYFTVE
ncbi:hypothetical protein FA13DRAFT_443084 [Coprinellus micaceus]|uniref:Carbohydrate-binding module family 19 domain-containing protein n=1 Tax=Coprinellus micaceus TaxID=71717 RepID=A0A4Y7TZZ1_COPMI|nr:hypothetical protein FA13DRAFT_443084 [Coprinellus micaceus]